MGSERRGARSPQPASLPGEGAEVELESAATLSTLRVMRYAAAVQEGVSPTERSCGFHSLPPLLTGTEDPSVRESARRR